MLTSYPDCIAEYREPAEIYFQAKDYKVWNEQVGILCSDYRPRQSQTQG